MPPALTIEGGLVTATIPDVCLTPPPPPVGPEPVPYPNMGDATMAEPAAENVFLGGSPGCTQASIIEESQGDDAGTFLGVASGMIMGPIEFTLASMIVKLEAQPALYQGNLTIQNESNTMGAAAACVNEIVMING